MKDYRIPETNVMIEKGKRVIVPILGLHLDEEYYPNPELFDPDRFSDENKKDRHPYAHIPFGEGPRICIGTKSFFVNYHSIIFVGFRNEIWYYAKQSWLGGLVEQIPVYGKQQDAKSHKNGDKFFHPKCRRRNLVGFS